MEDIERRMRSCSLFVFVMLGAGCSASSPPIGGERSSGGSATAGGESNAGGPTAGGLHSGGAVGFAGGAASPLAAHDCSDGFVKCAPHATCVPKGASYECVCDDGYTGDGVATCSTPVQTPVCGDKICQTTETCKTCREDCGTCPKVTCAACTSTCATGTCTTRPCDGAQGCYAPPSSECDIIDGKECPAVPLFAPCKADAECGSSAKCFDDHCLPPPCDSLTGSVPCPRLAWPGVKMACVGTSCAPESCTDLSAICQLTCVAGAECPYGMTCTRGTCQ